MALYKHHKPYHGTTARPAQPRNQLSARSNNFLNGVTSDTAGVYRDLAAKFGEIKITSGHRSPMLNRKVGGAKRSQHIHHRALDMRIAHLPKSTQNGILRHLANDPRVGAIGQYASGNIHMDTRARVKGNITIWGQDRTSNSAPRALRDAVAGRTSRPLIAQSSGNSTGGQTRGFGHKLMGNLQRDFGLTRVQAAGFVGNLHQETGGFKIHQEKNPLAGRGGINIAQWTGVRRRKFEAWAQKRGLSVRSQDVGYQFLSHELRNTSEGKVLKDLRNATTVDQATRIVSKQFLRPGIPHMHRRLQYGRQYAGNKQFNSGSIQQAEVYQQQNQTQRQLTPVQMVQAAEDEQIRNSSAVGRRSGIDQLVASTTEQQGSLTAQITQSLNRQQRPEGLFGAFQQSTPGEIQVT